MAHSRASDTAGQPCSINQILRPFYHFYPIQMGHALALLPALEIQPFPNSLDGFWANIRDFEQIAMAGADTAAGSKFPLK